MSFLDEVERTVPNRELLRKDHAALIKFIRDNGWTFKYFMASNMGEWWSDTSGLSWPIAYTDAADYAQRVDDVLDRIQATRDDEATILKLVEMLRG